MDATQSIKHLTCDTLSQNNPLLGLTYSGICGTVQKLLIKTSLEDFDAGDAHPGPSSFPRSGLSSCKMQVC